MFHCVGLLDKPVDADFLFLTSCSKLEYRHNCFLLSQLLSIIGGLQQLIGGRERSTVVTHPHPPPQPTDDVWLLNVQASNHVIVCLCRFRGGSRIFLRGGAPINHIVFWQNTSCTVNSLLTDTSIRRERLDCIRKLRVISVGLGVQSCTLPLRSTPDVNSVNNERPKKIIWHPALHFIVSVLTSIPNSIFGSC